jgi:hypothetical protein
MQPTDDNGRGDDRDPGTRRGVIGTLVWWGALTVATVGSSLGRSVKLVTEHPFIATTATILSIVASVIAVFSFIVPWFTDDGDDDGGLREPEYAQRMQLIACDLTGHAFDEAATISRMMAEFEGDPSESKVKEILLVIRGIASDEFVRVEQNLERLQDMDPPGPPRKYREEHRDYEAALEVVSEGLREVFAAIPENVATLSLDELAVVLDDPELLSYPTGAIVGLQNIEVGDDFKRLSSCQVPTLTPSTTPTPTRSPSPGGSNPTPTRTLASSPGVAIPATPASTGSTPKPGAATPTPSHTAILTPLQTTVPPTTPATQGAISGAWHYAGEAGYFVFSLTQISEGTEHYSYEEFMGDQTKSGGGTATVEGSHVRLDGSDGFGAYEWDLELSGANSMTGDKYRQEFDLTFNLTLVRG